MSLNKLVETRDDRKTNLNIFEARTTVEPYRDNHRNGQLDLWIQLCLIAKMKVDAEQDSVRRRL